MFETLERRSLLSAGITTSFPDAPTSVPPADVELHNRSRTIRVDNFNDGNFNGWRKVDFSVGQPWGPGLYDASSRQLRIRSSAPVPADDLAAGAMNATWEQSEGDARFGNGIVRGTVRANTHGTTAGFLLRASTFPGPDHDYGFFGSSGFGTFYIERFNLDTGGQTILTMANPARHRFVAGKNYILEGGVHGDRIWMRAWEVGKRRPVLPMLSVRDGALGPEDGTLLCTLAFFDPAAVTGSVRVDATFDDITFKPLPTHPTMVSRNHNDSAQRSDVSPLGPILTFGDDQSHHSSNPLRLRPIADLVTEETQPCFHR